MTSQAPTAGVVGAGIAGLSAAIALRRAGFEVQVYERSQFKNEVGAAISTPPNATAVLRRWGFDFYAAKTVPNLSTRYAAAGDLGTVFESRYEDIETVMGSPSLSFHRVDLHNGLRALATEDGAADIVTRGEGTPVVIHLGCEVRGVDCDNGILMLADGTRVQKDLVIIADGAHSNLLADFLGRPTPVQSTGRSIYRWLVSMDEVMADTELAEHYRDKPPGFLGWFDAAKRILWVNYTCRGGRVLNNAVVHDTEGISSLLGDGVENELDKKDDEMSWHVPAAKETVLATLSNFHPAARRIVSMASEDGIRVHRLFKRPPLESFVRGKTAVVGDTAHVMMPTHAAGSAIAIESASVLEALFSDLEGEFDAATNGNSAGVDTEKKITVGGQHEVGRGRDYLIRERLRLFDKLRIPRCNLTMLVSNAGPEGLRVPGIEQEIRRFYHGPLPPKNALPWSDEFREVLFHHDAFRETQQAMRDEEAREQGGINGET
ncbi:FAD/NAD(P)-binding domain-containing protein [Xylaria sp. FL0043]|nr:FAD/NAD(P)-binding domain-containing protein [Xylaria sp. FL0043]